MQNLTKALSERRRVLMFHIEEITRNVWLVKKPYKAGVNMFTRDYIGGGSTKSHKASDAAHPIPTATQVTVAGRQFFGQLARTD